MVPPRLSLPGPRLLARRPLLGALLAAPLLAACDDTEPRPPNEPGSPAPEWSLTDFQPKSERFETAYGLAAFRGKPTVVALLAGWCNYRVGQALQMERLRDELAAEGRDAVFVGLNEHTAIHDQDDLTAMCTFPLFQDVPGVDAFRAHGGVRYDFFLYDGAGILRAYYPVADGGGLNLGVPGHRLKLKSHILGVS